MMTNHEICELIDSKIKKLWPSFVPTSEQLKAWVRNLKCFDAESIEKAAYDHYASALGQYKEPKLFAVIEKARAVKRNSCTSVRQAVHFDPTVFVKCVENKKYPYKAGQFFGVYPPARYYNDPDYILRAAESTRKKAQACYSGKWIVVQKTSYYDMLNS